MTPNFKPVRIRNPAHLINIRQCQCLICGNPVSEPHHLLRVPDKAMGRRSGDNWAVPLCGMQGHHRGADSVHQDGNETRWFRSHGIFDAPAIAVSLWASKDDLNEMQAIARRCADRKHLSEIGR